MSLRADCCSLGLVPREYSSGEKQAHAFVRYELGDRVSLARGLCTCRFRGFTLVDLPSRDAVQFQLGARSLATADLAPLLVDDDVSQIVAAQSAQGELVIRFVPRPRRDAARVVASLQTRIREQLGIEARVLVVDAVFPTGGKLRRFVIESS